MSEKAMAPHSSTPVWKIPRMEEPGMLQSMGSLRVGQDWATSFSLFTFMHWRRKCQPTPVFLPGERQERGSLVGCRLWGRTESDTTQVTWQQQQLLYVHICIYISSCVLFFFPLYYWELLVCNAKNNDKSHSGHFTLILIWCNLQSIFPFYHLSPKPFCGFTVVVFSFSNQIQSIFILLSYRAIPQSCSVFHITVILEESRSVFQTASQFDCVLLISHD